MSRLTWRSRSVLAAGAAAVLVGTGVAALATTGSFPGDDAPPASVPQSTDDDGSAELQRSLDELTSKADALESSLGTPTSTATSDAYDDDAYEDDAYEDDAYEDDAYEDDAYEDDAYEDHDDSDDDDSDDSDDDDRDDDDDSDDDDHGVEDEGDDD